VLLRHSAELLHSGHNLHLIVGAQLLDKHLRFFVELVLTKMNILYYENKRKDTHVVIQSGLRRLPLLELPDSVLCVTLTNKISL
jgi:hypothetical protein